MMAAEKTDVLLIGPPKPVIVNGLAGAFNLVKFPDAKDRDKFFAEAAPRVRGMAVAATEERVDGPFMTRFPRLEIVSSFGVGYDHVDARSHKRRGTLVRVAGDADGGAHENVRILRAPDLFGLLGDGEIAMDDAEPAQAPERDREARLGDGIHGGGEDRDVEADLVRKAGLGGDLGREDVTAGRDQEDVVEGQTFLGELVLPGQSAALTRASVSVRAN